MGGRRLVGLAERLGRTRGGRSSARVAAARRRATRHAIPRSDGPVFRVHALHRRFTVLAGPEANLFVTRQGTTHLRSREFWMDFDRELGAARSMLSMDGAEHARMRKAQKTGYSRSFIHEHLDDVIGITCREVAAWPLDEPVAGLYALQRIITDQLGTIAAGLSPRDYLDDMIVFVRTLLAARVTRQRPALLMRTPRFRRARQRIEGSTRRSGRPTSMPRISSQTSTPTSWTTCWHCTTRTRSSCRDRPDAGRAGAIHRRARHGGVSRADQN